MILNIRQYLVQAKIVKPLINQRQIALQTIQM